MPNNSNSNNSDRTAEISLQIDNDHTTVHATVNGDDAYRRAKDALDNHLDGVDLDDVVRVDVEMEAVSSEQASGDADDAEDDADDADTAGGGRSMGDWSPNPGSSSHAALTAIDDAGGSATTEIVEPRFEIAGYSPSTASAALSRLGKARYVDPDRTQGRPWTWRLTDKGDRYLNRHGRHPDMDEPDGDDDGETASRDRSGDVTTGTIEHGALTMIDELGGRPGAREIAGALNDRGVDVSKSSTSVALMRLFSKNHVDRGAADESPNGGQRAFRYEITDRGRAWLDEHGPYPEPDDADESGTDDPTGTLEEIDSQWSAP